jgi:hypothetical protein
MEDDASDARPNAGETAAASQNTSTTHQQQQAVASSSSAAAAAAAAVTATISATLSSATSTSTSTTTNTSVVVEDIPCWGSSSQCSLKDLSEIGGVKHETNIHFESNDFLALNKPADVDVDVRMDREYPCSVHKLLTYWYPPPSLVKEVQQLQKEQQLEQQGQ